MKVDWGFLEHVMCIMGFPEIWIRWTMMCISSVRYSILHAGHETQTFQASRGLRQGCPLSPYLFIICSEGFSALLHYYEGRGLIHGYKVEELKFFLIYFLQMTVIYFKANLLESQHVKTSIELYERASGQILNFKKSSVSFSANTDNLSRQGICNMLGVQETEAQGKYLGLPSLVNKNKKQIFALIKDKVWHHLHIWNIRLLSKAGKGVLIKTVLQALPIYAMRVFLLPLELCANLERSFNAFCGGMRDKVSLGVFVGLDGKN